MQFLLAAIDYDLFRFGPYEIFGPLKVHSFGLFVAIGLMLCFRLGAERAEKKLGIEGEQFQNFGLFLVVVGWIFAHIFNIIFYEPQKLLEDPLILFKVWGSISSYGGLFGGIIAAYIWKQRNKEKDFLVWCDLAAYALVFAWFFGRVGCASVHDHPGAITDFFLGISNWPPDLVTRHDLGLYEAMWWAVICVTVLLVDRKPRPKGIFLALVPMMYAPARFTFDFLRVGPEAGGDVRYFGLTPAQYFSIGIFITGIFFLMRVIKEPPVVWKEWKSGKSESDDGKKSGSKKSGKKKKTKQGKK